MGGRGEKDEEDVRGGQMERESRGRERAKLRRGTRGSMKIHGHTGGQ